MTILFDIAPETAVARKAAGRDRYEHDTALLSRVRTSDKRLAAEHGWTVINGATDALRLRSLPQLVLKECHLKMSLGPISAQEIGELLSNSA